LGQNRVAKHDLEVCRVPPSYRISPFVEPLDRRVIARAGAEHGGDRRVGRGDNAWTCERHLKSLLFARSAGLTSLREIVAGFGGAQSAVRPSQSARAVPLDLVGGQCRAAAVFRDIARALLPIAAGTLRREGEALILLLDATPIPFRLFR
jgi:hypothetical protein